MSYFSLKTTIKLPASIQTDAHLALPTDGRRGVVASFFQADKMDLLAQDFAKKLVADNKTVRVADLGASQYFPQSIRFAQAGCMVDAFDLATPIPEYADINAELGGKINYIQTDITKNIEDYLSSYQLIYANRFVSHIPFPAARKLLEILCKHLEMNGQIFLAIGLLDARNPDDYKDYHQPLSKRFSPITCDMSHNHQLYEPLCFYTHEEIHAQLLQELPLTIVNEFVGTTTLKIILSKTNSSE